MTFLNFMKNALPVTKMSRIFCFLLRVKAHTLNSFYAYNVYNESQQHEKGCYDSLLPASSPPISRNRPASKFRQLNPSVKKRHQKWSVIITNNSIKCSRRNGFLLIFSLKHLFTCFAFYPCLFHNLHCNQSY